jgi:murein DD-endopeptidase MepM/ murein hydrolase activator NlpD
MPQTDRSNVLIVRADGRGVRRFSVPRWSMRAAATVVVAAALANAALVADYARLRRDHGTLVAGRDHLQERARAIEPMERAVGELRDEIIGWDALHAAILKPLADEKKVGPGIGGPAVPAPSDGSAMEQVQAVLAHVRAESHRLRALARITRETGSVLAALPSKLPIRAAINSGFGTRRDPWTGEREFHSGVDLAVPSGTPVKASAPGKVRFAGSQPGYGTTVLVEHGHGIESRYGHLKRVSVTAGQQIEAGQEVGLSGNTGRSTAPHLHYEILVNGRPIDPRRVTRGD